MDADFVEDLEDPQFVDAFIKDWNESRLDMFALSLIGDEIVGKSHVLCGWNDAGERYVARGFCPKTKFGGVMRFYFQDRGLKAVTKCIRVTSTQTVKEIMPTLIEKFCPDMKMLSSSNHELFEIHGTGDVRKLSLDERPLIVQCLWHKDDREGRFVLKSANLKIQPQKFFEVNVDEGQLRRRLSRREKKDLKRKRKEELARKNKSQEKLLADHVYKELPESSLTRTISNPEAVMRRRRQQKLEKRLKELKKEGLQTTAILKIFAESLKPEIPYKSILASVRDNTEVVTKAALEKFLLEKEDPKEYDIVMAIIKADSSGGVVAEERILNPNDNPLAIQNSWPKDKGVITFHLKRKRGAPDRNRRETNKRVERTKSESGPFKSEKKTPPKKQKPPVAEKPTPKSPPALERENMPIFLELTPEGKEINYKPKIYHIGFHETIIGSSRNPSPGVQYLQLFSPKILASHCSIVNVEGTVSIVPHGPDADVRINGQRIYDNTIMHTGNQVQFGGLHTFRFVNPLEEMELNSKSGNRNSLVLSSEYQPYKGMDKPNSFGLSSPPISPELKEKILNEQVGSFVDEDHIETTFGVDGEIETNKSSKKNIWSARSAENLLDAEHHQLQRESLKKHRQSAPDLYNIQSFHEENLLPASLSFLDQGRDAFFAAIISEVNGIAVNFKLAPTYTLYLAGRYLLSPEYRPSLSPTDRTKMLNSITKRISLTIQQTIQENDTLAGGLAFWMANASELLHFYRQDLDLGPLTQSAQAILAQSIQESFALLVNTMEEELSLALPAFLDPSDTVDIHPADLDQILNDDLLERAESTELLNWTNEDVDSRTFRVSDPMGRPISGEQWITPAARIRQHGMPIMADVLYILSSAMSLLRRCRVNAALTIQLFSQLFHYINMWVFNRIVLEPDLRLCTRLWGHCLRMRLSYIEAWAERQGLELAADCHLARVVQAAHLLEAVKETAEDIADVASTCFKLNSLQLRVLLENYLSDEDEPLIPQELIDSIVAVAESTSDELSQNDGYEIKLEEDIQLQLPFLLPEEGYSSDIIRGVPPGLQEFLEPLCSTGLCELRVNSQSAGIWTVYQDEYEQQEDLFSGVAISPERKIRELLSLFTQCRLTEDSVQKLQQKFLKKLPQVDYMPQYEIDNRDSQVVEELPIERITIDKGKSGLGLSICAAKGAQSDFTGIYIKAVIKGGLAEKDGRLEAGDQILSVNENGLVDVTQTQAAKIMGKSGPVITMEVIKRAVFYHGLSKLIEEDSKDGRSSYPNNVDGSRESKERNKSQSNHSRQASQGSVQNDHSRPHSRNSQQNGHSRQHSHSSVHNEHSRQPSHTSLPENHSRNPSNLSQEYYPERVKYEQEEQQNDQQFNDSDYDEDGNLLSQEEKARLARQRQRQIEYEERLAKWEAQRKQEEEELKRQQVEEEALEKKRYEEERIEEEERKAREHEEERRLEEEAERRYEEEVRRKKVEREEEIARRRQEEERKRAEAEQREREEEERRVMEELQQWEQQEKIRKEEEARRRKEEEELQRRKEEEERRLQQEKLERERIRREKEEAEQRKRREEEERRRKEEEKRRREEEQRAREREEEERRIAEERLRALREEERIRKEEMKREAEEKMRQEKIRLIEERRKKEADDAEREKRRFEAEEKRRIEYERQVERRRQEQEQLERDRMEREKAAREEERKRKEVEEKERRREQERRQAKAAETAMSRNQLDKEMESIDDALREAERIAAEMDLFMFEEEQKIEEDSKMKRKKEEQDWQNQSSIVSSAGKNSPRSPSEQQKRYRIENKPLRRSASKENILETNLDSIDNDSLPPPPEDLLPESPIGTAPPNFETNIDSSSEDEEINSVRSSTYKFQPKKESISQRDYMQQQREKHEQQRREQEILRREKMKKIEEERRKREEEMNMKKQEERQREEYRKSRETQERSLGPAPVAKPKSFKPDFLYKDNNRGNEAPKNTPLYNVSTTSNTARVEYSPDKNTVVLSTNERMSSDEEDAPPRPPPPRPGSTTPKTSPGASNSSRFSYSSRNGYQNQINHNRTPSNSSLGANDNTGLVQRPGKNVYNKVTPPPATVNQGVGEPEVLDFRAKMKLFGKFQG